MSVVLKPSDFAATQPRYNIYTIIQKGLRGFMVDTLLRWGKADVADEAELVSVIAQARGLLDMCAGHLHHENEFIHPVLESARVGAATQTRDDHVEHETAIAGMRKQVAMVEAAQDVRRAELAQQFYLQLSVFVAENFEHMMIEETANHAVLSSTHSDAEILAIEHRIVSSLKPEQSFIGLRWMLSHINATERAFMLGGMKRNAPPPVFATAMGLAREVLSDRDFNKLETALA